MATEIKRRRGTTAQHTAFTGALGEFTYNSDRKTVVAHDGATPGGNPMMGEVEYDPTHVRGDAFDYTKFHGVKSRIYATIADAQAAVIPVDTIELRLMDRGGARFRPVDTTTYNAVPVLLRFTDAGGRKWIINEWKLKPAYAGGDDTGATDATAAINAVFDYVRSDIAGESPAFHTKFLVDFRGGKYLCSGSINATGLGAWNIIIRGGVINSEAAGLIAFDLYGSRGYKMYDTQIELSTTLIPAVGIGSARTVAFGACDNALFQNVTVTGYSTIAHDYCYGQETTKRDHCRYYNTYPGGRCGIYTNYAASPPASQFQTVVTGEVSFINNTYDICDWRQQPSGYKFTIASITKGATTHIETTTPHSFSNGQDVVFSGMTAIGAMNSLKGTASNVTSTGFDVNIDSSGFAGSGASSGSVTRAYALIPVYCNGMKQQRFNVCYITSYAESGIEFGSESSVISEEVSFDFLFEGAPWVSHYKFNLGGLARKIRDIEIKGYSTHSRGGLIAFDGGTGSLQLDGGWIKVPTNGIRADMPLCAAPAQLKLLCDFFVLWPTRASAQAASLGALAGKVAAVDDGKSLYGRWNTTWTPTITGGTGSTGAATATAEIEQISDTLAFVRISITVSSAGDWGSHLVGTWPTGLAAAATYVEYLSGRSNATGNPLNGQIIGGASNFLVRDGNVFPGTGTMSLSGVVKFASLV